jgi:anti-sigma factor RsiW
MKCEDCRVQMPQFWEGVLEDDQRADVEMHLVSCALCRSEVERLGAIWRDLGEMPLEQPSREMRTRFYERLSAYQQGFAEAAPRPGLLETLKSWWIGRPALQAGLSLATLVIGFGAGFLIDRKHDNTQLDQLRTEVTNMRQVVVLSLLQQQGATDRLKGVNYAIRFEQPDTEVLSALLYTVNHDPNVNVRLSAVDALRTYADSPVARRGMLQAIGKQESPMVQIALIDQLADLRDHAAVPALQDLAKSGQANPEVKQRAQWAIARMQ